MCVVCEFFRLQGGDVIKQRKYDHFDTVSFGNVDGFSFRLVPVRNLRAWFPKVLSWSPPNLVPPSSLSPPSWAFRLPALRLLD